MGVLVAYETSEGTKDNMCMYASPKCTIKDLENRIMNLINKNVKILYVRF